MVPFLIIIIIN